MPEVRTIFVCFESYPQPPRECAIDSALCRQHFFESSIFQAGFVHYPNQKLRVIIYCCLQTSGRIYGKKGWQCRNSSFNKRKSTLEIFVKPFLNRLVPFGCEKCGDILARALGAALADLENRYGKDRSKWRWDVAHYAQGEHRPFGNMPVIGPYFNVEVPSPGGSYTLNRGKMVFGEEPPFANRHGSSFRAVYDFADLERSLYIHTTGQSGNPMSPHYRSFAERWSQGEYIEIPTRREAIDKLAIGTWKLTPP